MPMLSTRGGRSAAAFGLGNGGFTPQALALFARMTTPPTAPRKIVINRLYNDLISAGVLSKMAALYVFAAADSQAALLNWITTGSASVNGSPVFTTDRGYDGNSAGYLTGAVNTLAGATDSSFGQWWITNPGGAGRGFVMDGTSVAAGAYVPGVGTSNLYLGSVTPSTFSTATGYVAATRSSGAGYTRRNASSNTSVTDVGGVAPSAAPTIFWDGASGYYAGQNAITHYGSALTGTQLAQTEAAFLTYLTAIGAYP